MSRGRILAGAQEILDRGVFGDLTVDALARSLHMSKSTLYKYFASKEDVIVALVDGVCLMLERDLEQTDLTSPSAAVALDRLVSVVAAHADRIPRATLLQESRLPDAAQNRFAITRARIGGALREIVLRGHAGGELRFAQPTLAAFALLASFEASMSAAARGDLPGTRGSAVRSAYALIIPGLVGSTQLASA
jgi:AcrR family transcriptional regulator